jgi:hypothetical protein
MITINDPKTGKTFQAEPTTRDEYLKLRADWRAEYADQSKRIRAKKLATKALQRVGDDKASMLQASCSIMRHYANEMMEQRRKMKLIAAASYHHFRKEQDIAA